MVYPHTALPVVVAIAPGAAPAGDPGDWLWTDVTDSWRLAGSQRIVIDEGRDDWGDLVDAGTCQLVLDNRTGDFSERNPLGQWYGQLGRDTPLRVSIRRGADAFGRTESNGWGIADSGQTWTRVNGSASDFSVSSGAGRISNGTTDVLRRVLLDVDLVDLEQVADVTTPALSTGAAIVSAFIFRYVDGSNYYWASCEFNAGGTTVTLKVRKYVAGVLSELGALAPVPALAYAAGTPMRVRAAIAGNRIAVKAWPAASDEPAGWHLEVEDDDASLPDPGQAGVLTWRVSGNTNVSPVLTFDSYALDVHVYGGFVESWLPRWDKSGNDRTVAVTARGTLWRLQPGTGKPPARSALRRYLASADDLVAYWPVEEGGAAGSVASAIPGHPAMSVSGDVVFAAVEDVGAYFVSTNGTRTYGTLPLADLSAGGSLAVAVPADVTAATATEWGVSFGSRGSPPIVSADTVWLEWTTPGATPYVRWRLVCRDSTTGEQLYGINAAGVATLLLDTLSAPDRFWLLNMHARQNGGNIDIGLEQGNTFGTYGWSTSIAGTLAGITTVRANPLGQTMTDVWPMGHICLWSGHPPGPDSALNFRVDPDQYGVEVEPPREAFANEAATDRLARLAAEDGVTLHMPTVDVGDVSRMMWQPAGTALELYRQCEAVDGGVLFERPFSLAYQPRGARYDQTPTLTLDVQDDLGEAPEPDYTNKTYRNRWTVKRTDGSEATTDAPDIAAGALVYDDSIELLAASDADLPDQCGWRLHLSTDASLRWPRLTLNLAARPDLLDAWLNTRVGSRIVGTNPPADVLGDDIDVLVEGWNVQLGWKDFDVVANCSPARPWEVAYAGGDPRVPADGSTLGGAINSAATSFTVTSTADNGLWVAGDAVSHPDDFPMLVRLSGHPRGGGGEVVEVDEITGASSPQTFSVSARAVNGVAMSHAAGALVDVADPAIQPL